MANRGASALQKFIGAAACVALIATVLATGARPAYAASGDVLGGTVFRDEGWDGAKTGDLPEAGIEILVTDALGTTVGPYTSDASGTWSTGSDLDPLTGPYRVAFSIPAAKAPLEPGPLGTDMRSNVQVVSAGDTTVDFGVVYPYHYCQNNPNVVLNCYIEGDQSTGGDVLVMTEYLASGDGTQASGVGTAEFPVADSTDIGSTWGLAVQTFNDRDASNDVVWAAAMEKRFAGYGPAGPDAIYLVNPNTGSVLQTITSIDAGTDVHDFSLVSDPVDGGSEVVDAASYPLVGKQGWGDLDLNDEQDRMYAVNLLDRTLYEFDVDPTSGGYLSSTNNWNLVGLPGQTCSGTIRPWAVGFNEGEVFVGTTCDDGTVAYVHSLDPSGTTFVNELTVDLTYQRQPVGNHVGSPTYLDADWRAWSDTWQAEETGWVNEWGYPQPILSDIEFDRDGLVLGLRDRYGDQAGANNASTNYPGDNSLYTTDSAGDILRACADGSGGYVLEGGAGCAVTNGSDVDFPNAGPGGNEWYDGDNYLIGFGSGIGHDETSLGGLATTRNGDVLMTAYDALDDTFYGDDNHAFSSGLARLDNTTGDKIGQYRVYGDGSANSPGFGKAAGLGDIEAFCLGAPVMIGNFVWLDANADGIQDPGEEPLAGVVVTLYAADGTTVIDSATTTADGFYSFEVDPDTSYVLGIDPSAASAPVTTVDPILLVGTFADEGADDELDSDMRLQPSGEYTIAVTTGEAGENDYSFDAGFVEANHRVGNLVWLDSDDSGTADDGEPGISGLDVQLYVESGDAAGFDAQDQLFGTTTTDTVGNYWFDGLADQTYYVGIPADQSGNTIQVDLGSGAETIDVAAMTSSTGINAADADGDNVDDGDPAVGFLSLSGPVAVTDNAEPTGEADSNEDPDRDAETYVEAQPDVVDKDDSDSNLTVDFGFYPTPRIGGLLWVDGALGDAGYNDGSADSAENSAVIANAGVELWEDSDGSGDFDPANDTLVGTTTTDASGNYYFNGVDLDDYFVAVPIGQTGQTIDGSSDDLSNYGSSTGSTDADTGADDVDDGEPTTGYASVSEVVTVALGDNPTNEAGDFGDNTADAAETDANATTGVFFTDDNSDLTIDFGFIEVPTYEIGNLVWHDYDNDGLAETGEPGIAGVLVELWEDTDDDDIADTLVTSTNTDAQGKYNFPGLPAGEYVVVIPDDQSAATTPAALTPFLPSSNGIEATPNSDVDNNTNGATAVDLSASSGPVGNASGILEVGEGTDLADEPTTEQERTNDATANESPTGEEDSRSNLTVDFGYYSLRLGNQVWEDTGAGANEDNGVFDSDESGIDGVTVELWEDTDSSGDFDPVADTIVATTTTDGEGNYWFVGLADGQDYIVAIPEAGNSGASEPLNGLQSSTGQTSTAGGADNVDDGAPDASNSYLSVSTPVSVTATGAPSGETDTVPVADDAEAEANAASTTIPDDNSNLYVDFGFATAPTYEIGNLVWHDYDNDGLAETGEPGLAGVLVQLWEDTDDDDIADTLVTSTNTDAQGKYNFPGLPAGEYVVVIPDDQTTATTPTALDGYRTSSNGIEATPNSDVDNNTNGATAVDLSASSGPVGNASGILEVGEGTDLADEPTTEQERTNDATANESPTGLRDDRSNLTVDFGYYSLSLGNQVWEDVNNNGTIDGGEPVFDGVVIELYVDANDDGQPDTPSSPIATDSTDASGLYLFTGLEDGQTYVVVIPASQFSAGQPLAGFFSSTPTETEPDDDADSNDNGLPQVDGSVSSGPVTLDVTDEPASETPDNDPATPDDSENLTVDFGFYQLSIGNQVWFDHNNDGDVDGGEGAAVGVVVELWEDTTDDGNADTLIDTTSTNSSGQYLFDGLPEGDYVVVIPASEFGASEPLDGYTSSTPTEVDPNDDVDLNDNGIPQLDGSVQSGVIELRADGEPTGESPDSDPNTPDLNENLTVDFGFYQLRLGNQVWADIGAGANEDNGVFDTDESGIENVVVELWIDSDASGDLDPTADELVSTTTTDSNGNYWFDGLLDDTAYIVAIPESGNAGLGEALENTGSSSLTSADPNSADNDDDGAPQTDYRAVAAPVTLNAGGESTGETDTGDAGTAEAEANAAGSTIPDANSNLRVDFGFVTPPVFEIGNLVWADDNNNGVVDGAETGIEGVLVELWRDTNSDGIGDVLVDTEDTDVDGHYVFDMVFPGDYIVVIPNDQTTAVDPAALDDLLSSDNGEESDPNADADDNDNGVDLVDNASTGGPFGLASGVLTVGEGIGLANEPTDEVDESPSGLRDDRSNLSVDFGFYGLSLGNQLWHDVDNDGLAETGEPPLVGVTVNLWEDTTGDGNPDTLVATDSTNSSGLYLFEGLPEGDYIIEIPASEFVEGAPLHDLHPTNVAELDANTGVDSDSNGLRRPDGSVQTGVVTLTAAGAPAGEDPDNDTNPVDDNSDLSVDVGFYGLTLGNRVWFDTDADGVQDIDEDGAGGVAVILWLDANNDGVADVQVGTTVTDPFGHYLFTGLTAGDYIVEIPSANFDDAGALNGWISSTGGAEEADPNTDGDLNDNGVDPAMPGDSVLSNVVTLSAQGEPTNESDIPTGHDGPFDDSSNVTVDFGFYNLSLGNRIWADENNNGEIDDGELGIGGVTVQLFTDNDGDGAPDDTTGDGVPDPVQTVVTDPFGFYEFEGLFPGTYVVGVPPENFVDGGPLDGMASSEPTTSDPEDNADSDDNGIDPAVLGDAVYSLPIVLAPNTEPVTEDDSGSGVSGIDDDSNLTVDFGFFQTSRVGNYVWFDSDRDGQQDDGEDGVADVQVELIDSDGSVVATTVTDDDGLYIFEGVTPGEYTIRFVSTTFPIGYTPTTNSCGCGVELDSNVDGPSTVTTPFTLQAGDNDLTIDLGLVGTPPQGPLAFTGLTSTDGLTYGFVLILLGVPLVYLSNRQRLPIVAVTERGEHVVTDLEDDSDQVPATAPPSSGAAKRLMKSATVFAFIAFTRRR